jgi:hypothetical protein
MNQELRFSADGAKLLATLEEAFDWCEECRLVTDVAALDQGEEGLLALALRYSSRVRGALLDGLEAVEEERIAALHRSGCLRRWAGEGASPAHFAWFERGEACRLVFAAGALGGTRESSKRVWLFWQGSKGALPQGLQAVLDDCWASSSPVAADEPLSGPEPEVVTYSRPIPSVREVLGIRSVRDFFELEPEAQELALWSALIGEGPVDLEQAIRLCAERLRLQGFLNYQVLRQDGRVHQALEERLLSARRNTSLFDRPKSGFVRAVQENLDELSAEQWRDCVMGALEVGARVDRDQAVRQGFEYALEVYGVQAQRLRGGGRADQALRSAINSSIRQGYLIRDGAAYLVRVAEEAGPTLRGVVTEQGEADSAVNTAAPAEAEPPAAPEVEAEAASEAEPDVAESRQDSALYRKLVDLDISTRLSNWATRNHVETVRDLVAWTPEAFAEERHVGRRTVRETHELIQAVLGCSWEEAHRAVVAGGAVPEGAADPEGEESVDSTTEALTAGGPAGWRQLAATLSDDERKLPVVDVALPTRMRNFVRASGLGSLGELFSIPYEDLITRDNLGRKSLNDTLDAVREFLCEQHAPAVSTTFSQAWHSALGSLQPIPRMIVTRRAGMLGVKETLEELGAMLGITRERVRQIEARVLDRFRENSRLRRTLEARLAEAFGPGRAVPIDLLAEDPWWAGVEHQALLLEYVVERLFGEKLWIFDAPSSKRYLVKFEPAEFEARLESAKSRIAKLEYPAELSAVEAILHSEAELLDPILYGELERAAGELLHTDPEKPGIVLGYGRRRADEVIAFLSGQPEPVPVAEIERRFGRGAMPEEVLYFKRGVVGLKRHFPDFDTWMQRLVPAVIDVMKERPAGRQWLVTDLHDALQEQGLIPEWLGHWHLGSLLRLSGQVDYLGRLRVALKGSGSEERLYYEDLLEQVLEEAGGPLDFNELLTRARQRSDIPEASATLLVRSAPFVRLDETRVGLLERDIPGGPSAVAAAIEAIVQTLKTTQVGLTRHQATLIVQALSPEHATWTRQLVSSVLRNEASIRIDRAKNIGLDDWDDVRCPNRSEFIHREVQKAGGRLTVAEINTKLEATYGRALDRSALGVIVRDLGLTIEGDTITRPLSVPPSGESQPLMTDGASQPLVSRVTVAVPGIPPELRDLFEELVHHPLSDPNELRHLVDQHLAEMEAEHRVNEFVDVEGARTLARQCHDLLDRWDTLLIPDRHFANAAIRYFVSWQDLEHDLAVGGLDDDKKIMNAVLLHLGIEERLKAS